jgi:predicted dithiol-disulfide oxidoreductase (DUF899 family)
MAVTTAMPEIVSRDEWRAARDELLVEEKALTRALDRLAAKRRRLPMVPMSDDYRFATPHGELTLRDLFDGHRQLVVYQFMDNGPDGFCDGCSSMVDNVGRLEHLRARDTNFVVVSNMPLAQMQAFAKRMQWSFPFASSHGTRFADDCGAGKGFGISVFLRGGDSEGEKVYQTYFTAGRGCDRLRFDFNLLDLTPYGRQETWEDSPQSWPQTPPYQWWRHHDEY